MKFERVRPKIDPAVLQRLKGANIADMEALQERFYEDFDASLLTARQALNVHEAEIARLVAKSLVSTSEPLTISWIGKHWADLMLVLAFLYVALALLRPWLGPKVWPPKPQVVAATGIPIYGMIRDNNLRVKNPGARTQPNLTSKFVGRYAVGAIAAGAAITDDKLSSTRTDLTGQSVLQLEIKHAAPLDGRVLPESIDLVFSPRQAAATCTPLPALLLAFDAKANPPLATVAMAKDKADEAAKWIGSCDVYLSLRVR